MNGTIITMIENEDYNKFTKARLLSYVERMPLNNHGRGQFLNSHNNEIDSAEAIAMLACGDVVCLTSRSYCSLNPMKIRENREDDIKVTLSSWPLMETFYPKYKDGKFSWKYSFEQYNASISDTRKRNMIVAAYIFPATFNAIPISKFDFEKETKGYIVNGSIGHMFADSFTAKIIVDEHCPYDHFIDKDIQIVTPRDLASFVDDLKRWNSCEEDEPVVYVHNGEYNKIIYLYTCHGEKKMLFRAAIFYKEA